MPRFLGRLAEIGLAALIASVVFGGFIMAWVGWGTGVWDIRGVSHIFTGLSALAILVVIVVASVVVFALEVVRLGPSHPMTQAQLLVSNGEMAYDFATLVVVLAVLVLVPILLYRLDAFVPQRHMRMIVSATVFVALFVGSALLIGSWF